MKRFVFISAIFLSTVLQTAALEVSITVPVAGSLPYVLKQQYDWEKVTSLTVYGEINEDDCMFLRIMARGKKGTSVETLEYYNGSEKGSLQILDLGNATMKETLCSFPATELKKLTFPLIEEIKGTDFNIDSNMFAYCNNLEEVDLSKCLCIHSIGEKVFYKKDGNLKNLKKIILPQNLESISHDAFYGDFHISNLPSSLETIEYDAFACCTIDEADLGNVSDIGHSFWCCTLPEKMVLQPYFVRGFAIIQKCYGLKDLTFLYDRKGENHGIDSGTGLAKYAYDLETLNVNISRESGLYGDPQHYPGVSMCPQLKKITLNAPMFKYAYAEKCPNIEAVVFDCAETDEIVDLETQSLSDKKKLKFYGPDYSSTRKGYMTKDGALFYGNGSSTILQFVPRSVETYTIPESCSKFETDAFDDCTDLRILNVCNADFDESFWFKFNYLDRTITLGERSRYYVESDVVYRKSEDLLSLIELVRFPSQKEIGTKYIVELPFYKDAYLGTHPELTTVRIASNITDVTGLFPEATNLKVIEFEADRPPHVLDAENTLKEMAANASSPEYYISVPKGSGAYYYANPFWRQFQIKEYDSVTGIPSDRLCVHINGREMSVSGLVNGGNMEIVNALGQTVYIGSEATVTLPATGIYILRVGTAVQKVLVE